MSEKKTFEVVCAHCGTRCLGQTKKKRFCSQRCRERHLYKTNDVFRTNQRMKRSRKHGTDPQYVAIGTELTCPWCKTVFVKNAGPQAFCSISCRQKFRRATQPEWYKINEKRYGQRAAYKKRSGRPWFYLLQSARYRAMEKKIPFDLTDEWALLAWNNGHCSITGLPFQPNAAKGPHPFSPSVDRIDNTLGYTQANTRFILWGVNAIKGVGTDNDMYEIAKAIVSSAHKD